MRISMKKIFFSVTFLTLVVFICGLAGYAQTVSTSVKKKIYEDLWRQPECKGQYVQLDVKNVKIGENESGFIGTCKKDAGVGVLYTKTSQGLVKLLLVNISRKFVSFAPAAEVNKGRYDLILITGVAGAAACWTTYRWDGASYTKYKKSCDEE